MPRKQLDKSFVLKAFFPSPETSIFNHLGRRAAIMVIAWLFVMAAIYQYTFNNDRSVALEPQQNEKPATIPQTWRSLLPRRMWQIYLAPPNLDNTPFEIEPGNLGDAVTWLARNPDYTYVLVGDESAKEFAHRHPKKNSTLTRIFQGIQNTGMKSDLLRYLILSLEGGVYSDIDTENLKPIDQWVPEQYQTDVRAVVGVEFDRLDGPNWAEVHPDLQFCQWTIAATPGHPLFNHMIDRVISALQTSIEVHNTTFSGLKVNSAEVMELTGPAAWTDAVFQQLQEYEPDLVSLRNFTGLVEPMLVGDILILPVDGFGMGQPHSNSTNDGSVPKDALVKHNFRGLWRQHNNAVVDDGSDNDTDDNSHDSDTTQSDS
ncbi:hypothetical protein N7492_002420 [Penicillium capsulatum]|uniref:Initiation-specific alpha-1,6-mannosyltransferase n=1 Tax=Penicillium capsulatum TaxID=69766 RepID=A0A9W9III2_9EURO|nr:hypothetical protein N7492_002420 [Penicillium capsulatum]KAJ6122975.1 hypothetical protein N7512_005440 [Penicillium capsulatum]